MINKQSHRINGFDQIKAFYSWVFNNAQKRVTPQHVSLYLFLINQNNRNNWVEWFKCPLDLGMAGACIGNKKTYYNCLSDLAEWGFIEYEKGINEFKAPLIKLEVLKCTTDDTAEVPQSEPLPIPQGTTLPIPQGTTLPIPQGTTLPIPLPTHIYKLITNNLKPITSHFDEFEKFVLSLSKPKFDFIDQIIETFSDEYHVINQIEYNIISRGKERAAASKILKLHKEKHPQMNSEQTVESLKAYFKACVSIGDEWLRSNMSLPIIVSKFNEINNKIRNGNKRAANGRGATDAELAGIVAGKFATDIPQQ